MCGDGAFVGGPDDVCLQYRTLNRMRKHRSRLSSKPPNSSTENFAKLFMCDINVSDCLYKQHPDMCGPLH